MVDRNTTIIVSVVIAAIAALAVAGIVTQGSTTEDVDQADMTFASVATEDVSQMDAPWQAGNDLNTINQVVYTDEDQTTAGNATFNFENGTTIDDDYTSYINVEVDGSNPAPLTLMTEFENTGEFDEDNTNVQNVQLRDYDETDVVGNFDDLSVQQEEEVTVSGVEDGKYVLQMDYEFQSVTTNSAEGERDTVLTVDAELDSPDADSDEPTEIEDFSYDVLTE